MAAILGVSFQSVYAYIHGYRLPNITHLLNIAYALGTSINDLLVPRSDADLDLPVIDDFAAKTPAFRHGDTAAFPLLRGPALYKMAICSIIHS